MDLVTARGSMFIPEGSRTSAYMPACFKFRVPHHSQPTTPTPPSAHQAPFLTSLLGKDGMEDGRDEACGYPRMKTCIQAKSHPRVRVRVLPIPCPTSLPAHFTHTILPRRTVPKSALKCHKLAYLSADMHINTWSRIRAYPHVRIARRHNRIQTCMKTRACT